MQFVESEIFIRRGKFLLIHKAALIYKITANALL